MAMVILLVSSIALSSLGVIWSVSADSTNPVMAAEPGIIVTSPTSVSSVIDGHPCEIAWTWTGEISNVAIELYTTSDIFAGTITSNTPNTGSYDWTVDTGGYGYKVKVFDADNPSVYNYSEPFNIVMIWLIVTSPSTIGDTWNAGSSHQISWDSYGTGGNVTIELYKGGTPVSTISDKTYSSDWGSYYDWSIPSDTTSGADYKIRVTSITDPILSNYSSFFTIVRQPYINVTSPHSGDRWEPGTMHSITWDCFDAGETVAITLYDDWHMQQSTIAHNEANDGVFEWSIPLAQLPSPACRVEIRNESPMSILYDNSDYFEMFGPSINVTSPNSMDSWEAGTTHRITWTSYEAGPEVSIELQYHNSKIVSSTENDGSFEWAIPPNLYGGGDYVVVRSLSKDWVVGSAYFQLTQATVPWLFIYYPQDGASLMRGSSFWIYWQSGYSETYPGPYVSLELYKDGSYSSTITPFLTNQQGGCGYTWYVPLDQAVGEGYQVKVTSLSNSSIFSYSVRFSISNPVAASWIAVQSPTGTVYAGSTCTVKWTYGGTVGATVGIELWRNSALASVIASAATNNGNFAWSIPLGLDPSPNYQIKVVSSSNSSVYGLGYSFEIVPPNPWITVEYSGDTLMVNRTRTISWSSGNDPGAFVAIDLYQQDYSGASSWRSTIASNTSNDGEFDWLVSLPSSCGTGSYVLKVTSLSKSWVYGIQGVYISRSWMEVTSPVGGDTWELGTTHAITWLSNDTGNRVAIELRFEGNPVSVITLDTLNDGSFEWSIPASLPVSYGYRIWIRSLLNLEHSDGYWSEPFLALTSGAVATLSVIMPNGGETWSFGDTASIEWSSTGDIGDVRIELFKSGGYISTIAASTANDGSYQWQVPSSLSSGDDYSVKVTSLFDNSVADYSDSLFTIMSVGPKATITVTSPESGIALEMSTPHLITWIWSGNVTCVKIELLRGGASVSTIISNTSCDGSFEWVVPDSLAAGDDFKVRVSSVDDSTVKGESDAFSLSEKTTTQGGGNSSNLALYISVVSIAIAAISLASAVKIIRSRKE